MDKAIAKVNQNELDWYENFFQHSLFCTKNSRLFSDCTFLSENQIKNCLHLGSDHLGRDVCVNFIKTMFQILHNDVY